LIIAQESDSSAGQGLMAAMAHNIRPMGFSMILKTTFNGQRARVRSNPQIAWKTLQNFSVNVVSIQLHPHPAWQYPVVA